MSDLEYMLNAHIRDLFGLLVCCDCIVSIFAIVDSILRDSSYV